MPENTLCASTYMRSGSRQNYSVLLERTQDIHPWELSGREANGSRERGLTGWWSCFLFPDPSEDQRERGFTLEIHPPEHFWPGDRGKISSSKATLHQRKIQNNTYVLGPFHLHYICTISTHTGRICQTTPS